MVDQLAGFLGRAKAGFVAAKTLDEGETRIHDCLRELDRLVVSSAVRSRIQAKLARAFVEAFQSRSALRT